MQLSATDCTRADLILVMEREQKERLEQRYPFVKGRVYRVGHFSEFDVQDLYRKDRTYFEQCFKLLDQGVADWVERIESART